MILSPSQWAMEWARIRTAADNPSFPGFQEIGID